MRLSPGQQAVRLFLVALALRLVWVVAAGVLGVEQASDAGWYHARAVEIALGNGYAISGHPTAYWPVGWPGLLGVLYAVFGSAQVVGTLANAAFGALSAPLTFALAQRLGQNNRAGWIAGLLIALHPNHVVYAALLMAEPTALLLLLGGLLLLWRAVERGPVWAVAAGVLIGALALVKPQYVTLAGCWLLAADCRRGEKGGMWGRRLGILAIAGVAASVVCAPWIARNAQLYSAAPVLSNNDGVNLWFGNNPRATGAYISDSLVDRAYALPGENEYEQNLRARTLALDYIRARPLEAVGRVPLKLWYLWRADAEGFTLALRGLPEGSGAASAVGIAKYIAQGWWLLFVGAFIWSAIPRFTGRTARQRWSWVPLVAVGIVSLWGVLWFGDGRFHYPAIPFMAVAIGGRAAARSKG